MKGFKLSSLTYKRVMHLLNEEMNSGLHANSNYMADIKMFPTFVRSLPDGTGIFAEVYLIQSLCALGWSGGAMVLGKLSVPGRPY